MDMTVKRIAMLSTHGYFDAEPQLGRTDTGGQVVYVLELSKALTKQGIAVDIYTRWFDKSREMIESVSSFPNLRIIRIPSGPWKFVPKEEIYDLLPELAENMIDFTQENNLEYDLFHAHYVDAGVVAINVSRKLGKPVYFTAHSLGAWKRQLMNGFSKKMEEKYQFEKRIEEELKIFQAVNGQTATTKAQLQVMESLYSFQSENTMIIPPGVDIESFHPGKDSTSLELPTNYIFCLSRIDENKGHELLLNAFDIVRRNLPEMHLVIGGGSPRPKPREKQLLNKIERIIDTKAMRDRVHLVGYIPDEEIRSYYQQARVFVLPSTFEPFGMTALESIAYGTPAIVSKFAGISEFLRDHTDSIVTDPTDTEKFASDMLEILENKKLADQIRLEGMKIVRERFSWDAIAEMHLLFYKKYMQK
ncbi:glycosyltransferase family 1 protein [Candidatus Thorarchaeota archaeon]|nr:MAG: glycosyltransferase family 1 protein [Candidatus Thorarchaeota archaeon]